MYRERIDLDEVRRLGKENPTDERTSRKAKRRDAERTREKPIGLQ